MKKTAKIILVSAGAAMLMAGGVLGAVAVYDTANPRSSGDIVVKTEHVNLVWGEDGEHENTDAFEVAITDLNTTATDRYLTVAIEAEEGHTLAAGTYKGTLAFSIVSSAKDSMILPKLAVEVAENGTDNKVSIGADYKANLVVELTEQKTSALVKISYKLTENFGELTQEELTALAAEKLTATADWNIYSETPAPEPVIEDGYYFVGEFNKVEKWNLADGTKMSEEGLSDGNHAQLLGVELKKDDKLRVVKHEGEDNTWCLTGVKDAEPVNENYVVTEDGTYNIYVNGSDEVWVSKVEEPSQDPEPTPVIADGYYLVGKFNKVEKWDLANGTKMSEEDVGTDHAKLLGVELKENDELRVVKHVNGANDIWCTTGGVGNGNYTVTEDGTYNIYVNGSDEVWVSKVTA